MIATLLCALLASGPAREAARKPAPPSPAAAPSTSSDASPLSDAERDDTVDGYLGSIDTPIGRSRWRALGPKARAKLEAIAQDGQALPSRRARSLDGLAALGQKESAPLATALARDEAAPFVVRHSALRAAAALLGPKTLTRELGPLVSGARDLRIRALAAETLAHHGGTRGCALVLHAAKDAGEAAESKHWKRALEACEAAQQ